MIFGKKTDKGAKKKAPGTARTANPNNNDKNKTSAPKTDSGRRKYKYDDFDDDFIRPGSAAARKSSSAKTTSRQQSTGTTSRRAVYDNFDDNFTGSKSAKNTKKTSSQTKKRTGKAKKTNNGIFRTVLGNLIAASSNPTPAFKLSLFFAFCMVMLIVLIGRIAYWKIAYGTKFEAAAINNQVNKVNDKIISPNRGDILDRNNEQLAVGETVFNIILDVKILHEQDEIDKNDMAAFKLKISEAKTADEREKAQKKYDDVVADSAMVKTKEALKTICGISEDKVDEYVALDTDGNLKNDTNYLTIAKKVDYDKGKAINDLEYGWLYGEQDTKRTYPYGGLAAQVIGFIRGDTITGLENYYDDEMTGTPGRVFRTYESDNSVMTQQVAPQKGNTLVTTLDVNMQKFAEEACKEAYDAYSPEYTSSIIMNPQTGEVYAMAQYPTFDSNDPMNLSDLTDKAKKTAFDAATETEKYALADKAWKNFAITETFEPGSIFKPIVVAMALEEGVISPNDSFYCGGYKEYGGYKITCHNRYGHGTLSLEQVLAQSCNVGMMEIMSKLGKDSFYKYRSEFGYMQKTGIDLPAETAADSPMLNYTYDRLNETELATCSFGQGFNATAMQSLIAFNAVINGGNIMQPYIVSHILDQDGNVVKENDPHVVRKVISKETSDTIRTMLEAVVKPEATGKKAVINGYAIGGKTGTAQQGERIEGGGDYTLNFIAYHSIENPEICVMTVIHKPPDYSDTSDVSPAPMLKEIFEKIIDYESIPADYDGETTSSDVNTVTIKDYTNKSLKDTIAELNSLNIDFTVIGNGDTVIKQAPVAGTKLNQGDESDKILLNVTNSGKNTLVTIPDVTGLTESAAKKTLEAAGLDCHIETITKVTDEDDSDVTSYITKIDDTDEKKSDDDEDSEETEQEVEASVEAQFPAADIQVEKGTAVKIKVQ
jgi:stage V sporulation protein D (sporulation-specific penicillin-binding protein)